MSAPSEQPAANPKDRATLVLLSGLLCDQTIWSDVARILSDIVDVRIISFPSYASIGAMAQHVIEEISDHWIAPMPERVAIAGHSMGGRVALEVMRRAPDRVSALALLNTGVHGTAAHESASRGELVRLAREQGMTALAARWLPPMMGASPARVAELMPQLTAMVERNTAESYAGQIQALLDRPDATPVLPTIHVPTLLLSGTNDTWSPVSQHEEMLAALPDAKLVAIAEAGHMAPVEQPEAVAAALRQWLEAAGLGGEYRLTDANRMLIEHACARQIYRYATLLDAGAFQDVVALYTEQGRYARPTAPDKFLNGRAEILKEFLARPPRLTRHTLSTVIVDVESAWRARTQSRVVLYIGGASPSTTTGGMAPLEKTLIGQFHDVLERVNGEWLFAERRGSISIAN